MHELLGTPRDFVLIVFRTVVVYLAILVGFRLIGNREVGQLAPFDLALMLLIANAGAYGHAMSSHYNLRPPATELFI